MSREIKFRAFHKKLGVMLPEYGVLAKIEFDQSSKPCNIGVYEYRQINERGDGDWDGFEVQSEDFELMQFTGLKDKNDKEIYEGDILFWDGSTIGEVSYDYGEYIVGTGVGARAMCSAPHEELEVIGNIYENPGLLEQPAA